MNDKNAGQIIAFGAVHVCRLTGLSSRQLSYWDKTGFFSPQYAEDNRRRPFSRVYSFRDVVGLRTIAILRKDHLVPLQELRKVGAWLKKHHQSPWASLTFYVSGPRVFFDDPGTGTRMAARPLGHPVLPIAMERIAHEMGTAAERLRDRDANDIGRVTQSRYVVHNAPVLAGTRIPTSAVYNLHEGGLSTRAILREYPRLKRDDVEAALSYEQERQERRAG